MRSIVIDEVRRGDLDKVRQRLTDSLENSAMPDVFWLHLPPDLLTAEQARHTESCGPHRAAVVLEDDGFKVELLIRCQNHMRCTCNGYATSAQRDFLLRFVDRLVDDLAIMT